MLRYDDGAAPNPFWGVCTLVICKPAIRRTAWEGDWVIGTGSKKSRCNDGKIYDFSHHIVYAMKITRKMSLLEYDTHCIKELPRKIPAWQSKNWKSRVGDCIYDYSCDGRPRLRDSVHEEGNAATDMRGEHALLSTHFYYFGEKPRLLPENLYPIIKSGRGHKKIEAEELVSLFESWIAQFQLNKIYADPQLRFIFDSNSDLQIKRCTVCRIEDEADESEEILC